MPLYVCSSNSKGMASSQRVHALAALALVAFSSLCVESYRDSRSLLGESAQAAHKQEGGGVNRVHIPPGASAGQHQAHQVHTAGEGGGQSRAVKYNGQGQGSHQGIVYDQDGNPYMAVPQGSESAQDAQPLTQAQVEAAAGPIWEAIKAKYGDEMKGGSGPQIAFVPAPQQQPAPAPVPPPQPRASANAYAPTTPTTVGSGGIDVTTSTPVSVSNPIEITAPSSSAGGGLGFSLFGR